MWLIRTEYVYIYQSFMLPVFSSFCCFYVRMQTDPSSMMCSNCPCDGVHCFSDANNSRMPTACGLMCNRFEGLKNYMYIGCVCVCVCVHEKSVSKKCAL